MIRSTLLSTTLVALVVTTMPVTAQDETTSTSSGKAGVPPGELDKLFAPIALYPDLLISQILPACTYPIEVVQAGRWLKTKPDPTTLDKQLESKTWQPSVKALCHYPDVLKMLDQDLDRTNSMGTAFLDQQGDVMASIQRLRTQAKAAGSLVTNKQQTIVVEKEVIRIVPTQTNVVYVPVYNPQVVYVPTSTTVVHVDDDDDDDELAAAVVGFTAGLALGAWLDTDCDWHGGNVYYCKPGYWGGWPHRGVVAYGDGWAAGAGPRRAFAVGDDRGVVVGPRGAAAWNDGHGKAWARNPGYARPVYSGRYSGYNTVGSRTQVNRAAVNSGNIRSNNDVTINRNQYNVDRGHTPAQANRPSSPANRSMTGSERLQSRNAGTTSPSTFGRTQTGTSASRYGQRGATSRGSYGNSPTRSTTRPSSGFSRTQSSGLSRSSAFGSMQSRSQAGRASARGGMSRGGGGGRRR